MFSITIFALSTTMPTPIASPPRDMIFKSILPKYINMAVAVTQIGMAAVIIKDDFNSQRKKKRTMNESMPP